MYDPIGYALDLAKEDYQEFRKKEYKGALEVLAVALKAENKVIADLSMRLGEANRTIEALKSSNHNPYIDALRDREAEIVTLKDQWQHSMIECLKYATEVGVMREKIKCLEISKP